MLSLSCVVYVVNVPRPNVANALLLVAAVAVIGFVFNMIEKDSSDTKGFTLSTDTVVAEEKTLIAEEKPDNPIEEIVPTDIEKTNSPEATPSNQQSERENEREKVEKERKEWARREILSLVNRNDLSGCRDHRGWLRCLTNDERNAIETTLYYLNGFNEKLSLTVGDTIKRLIDNNFPFKSFDEIINVRKKIIDIKYEDRKEQEELLKSI